MKCTIVKAAESGIIKAIPSKSAAHRWLIAAALSGLDFGQSYCDISQDIDATKDCLKAICSHSKDDKAVLELNPRESGSTLRFLLPIAAALGIDSRFNCEGRLASRPMEIMRNLLEEHGCDMTEQGINPIEIKGSLKSGVYSLPGNVSSQYVTGLLFALPLLEGDSVIRIEGELQSKPYVNLTLGVLERAGINIKEEDNQYIIKGNQKYSLRIIPEAEGDWSNSAFWLVLDAINQMHERKLGAGIEVTGLKNRSKQGDREIVNIIKRALSEAHLTIDASDIPDLIPVVSILACARPLGTKTYIVNAERLRYKESDRLAAITDMIRSLGGTICELQDGLIIDGMWELAGGTVDSHNDHRIAMAAAVAATCSKEPVTIERAEAVRKSYPGFYEDYEKLGGVIDITE